jgi:hypothetical protein
MLKQLPVDFVKDVAHPVEPDVQFLIPVPFPGKTGTVYRVFNERPVINIKIHIILPTNYYLVKAKQIGI